MDGQDPLARHEAMVESTRLGICVASYQKPGFLTGARWISSISSRHVLAYSGLHPRG